MFLDNGLRMNSYPDEKFFPPWGWLEDSGSHENYVISNVEKSRYPGKDNSKKLFWRRVPFSAKAGYVCEKHGMI